MLEYVLQGLKYRAGTEGGRVYLVSEKREKPYGKKWKIQILCSRPNMGLITTNETCGLD